MTAADEDAVVFPMKSLIKHIIGTHRALILNEASQIHGFMRLLMKQVNTDEKWTKDEKAELKRHLKHLSMYIPVLIIFCLPFGMLLIPILAETLDRRSSRRPH
ncbi:MAG TPA: LETM1 domain-containing protein [Spirochaetota bacterium]|nr:LETM1 domain-containing protein [Spirochaetota bacterium]HQH96678.1 LETM1 domain-containing protein [Spirochaetota bacterium]HQJ69878.1 LETM1 domain-containing protein [Spirochaetota bacterium]